MSGLKNVAFDSNKRFRHRLLFCRRMPFRRKWLFKLHLSCVIAIFSADTLYSEKFVNFTENDSILAYRQAGSLSVYASRLRMLVKHMDPISYIENHCFKIGTRSQKGDPNRWLALILFLCFTMISVNGLALQIV